jgi:hypothetical protein
MLTLKKKDSYKLGFKQYRWREFHTNIVTKKIAVDIPLKNSVVLTAEILSKSDA